MIKFLPLVALLISPLTQAKDVIIPLEDNAQILGKWSIYAETAALHKTKKLVNNKWDFKENGSLVSTAFDPRLDSETSVKVKYFIEDGFIKKQVQPGREKYETCKVVKLEGKDLILHCKYLYYLLRR